MNVFSKKETDKKETFYRQHNSGLTKEKLKMTKSNSRYNDRLMKYQVPLLGYIRIKNDGCLF